MVMIRVFPETVMPVVEGTVIVPAMCIVNTSDEALAAYHVSMNHATYDLNEPGVIVPVNLTAPQLDKLTAGLGDVVKCSQGTWEGVGLEFYYKWDIDGVDIPSAVTAQHTITVTDLGKSLMCRVRALDPSGGKLIVDCEAPCLVETPTKSGKK